MDKAIDAMNNIPFENIIGGPLSACIKAQSQAACSTVEFIESVGLEEVVETEKEGNPLKDAKGNNIVSKKAVYVTFSYIQNGKLVNIMVPLLAIVPIPYIGINSIDISFKAAISSVDSESTENTSSYSYDKTEEKSTKKGGGWLTKKTTTNMKTSISSKRDSKATQDSTFSIEATIDVNVRAGQESMPSGMAKILELLNSSVQMIDTKGELTYEGPIAVEDGKKVIIARYKNPEGLYEPASIRYGSSKPDETTDTSAKFYVTTSGDLKVEGNDKVKVSITL